MATEELVPRSVTPPVDENDRMPVHGIDHVEFYVKPGQTLGSRGSTDGVGFYDFDEDDAMSVLRYGRLKKEFTQS